MKNNTVISPMYFELINMFNVIPTDCRESNAVNVAELNKAALQAGYFVMPEACNEIAAAYIKEKDVDRNSTFYKTIQDVVSRSRFELLMDQLLHYASTYGTGFTAEPFVMNDGDRSDVPELDMKNAVILAGATSAEIMARIANLFYSGVALKGQTLDVLFWFIQNHLSIACSVIDPDKIANREALTRFCSVTGVYPNDKFNLLRYIVYVTTGETMLIKNQNLVNKIKSSVNKFDFNKLSEKQLEGLASIFYRYKPLFLAFKHTVGNRVYNWQTRQYDYSTQSSVNAGVINKLRRMAPSFHTPFTSGFWETLLFDVKPLSEIQNRVGEITNYKKVTLMQTILNKLDCNEDRLFIVRNQKMFTKKNSNSLDETARTYLENVYNILRASLVEALSAKKCVVKYPEFVNIALPTSEKNFVGNYPFGTKIELTSDNMFGVYWRNEWGARDIDLSTIDLSGTKTGWNARYYDEKANIVFSGDMTSAQPEATEIFYFNDKVTDMMFKANLFSGEIGSKMNVFVARCPRPTSASGFKNYMVNPNDIVFNTDIITETKETTIGVVSNNELTLMTVNGINSMVSYGNKYSADMINALKNTTKNYIALKPILTDAGFTEFSPTAEYDAETEILDLTKLEKDMLIQLMSDVEPTK